MRAPSLKTLAAAFPQSELAALQVFKAKAAKAQNWRTAAQAADSAIEGHGIEVIRCPSRGLIAAYVNTGDTYSPTLLLNLQCPRQLTWHVTTWGDFVESFERRHGRVALENLSQF